MSTEDGQFNGEHPYTRPEGSDASMFIQWKNTKICMDFICQCGANVHGDGYFAYNVECGACGAFYEMGLQVIAKRVQQPTGACLLLEDDDIDYTVVETVTLPDGQEGTVLATTEDGEKYVWAEMNPGLAVGGLVKGPPTPITIDLRREQIITAEQIRNSPSAKAALDKFRQSVEEIQDHESRDGDSPNT